MTVATYQRMPYSVKRGILHIWLFLLSTSWIPLSSLNIPAASEIVSLPFMFKVKAMVIRFQL